MGDVIEIEGEPERGGDPHQGIYVMLTRTDCIDGYAFVVGQTLILVSDELYTPARAREFAALLIEAADLAER